MQDRSPREFPASRQVHPKGGGLELTLRFETGSSQWGRTSARLHEDSTSSHHAGETGSSGEVGHREAVLLGVAGLTLTDIGLPFDGFHLKTRNPGPRRGSGKARSPNANGRLGRQRKRPSGNWDRLID